MILASLNQNLVYDKKKPSISVLMETASTKEIRILMKKGQVMKEHQTPFPIVVEVFEGSIDFGVEGENYRLDKGSLVSLEAGKPHNLICISDCVVRLSLSKKDKVERVKAVLEE